MSREPLVSIITPSFNQARFIGDTLASVATQDYPHIEHIVIDGGSTDGTLDILRENARGLVWLSEPDNGQSEAINKGFKMAKGDIIGWLNSDDCYRPGAVRRAVDALLADPGIDLVYGYCDKTDEQGRTLEVLKSPEFDRRLIFSNPNVIYQPTVFFRRSLLDKAGPLDESLHFAMDFDLWLRMAQAGEFKLIPEVLATYRFTADSKSEARDAEFWPEVDRILRKHGEASVSPLYLALHRHKWAHRLWSVIKNPWLTRMKNRLFGFWQASK